MERAFIFISFAPTSILNGFGQMRCHFVLHQMVDWGIAVISIFFRNFHQKSRNSDFFCKFDQAPTPRGLTPAPKLIFLCVVLGLCVEIIYVWLSSAIHFTPQGALKNAFLTILAPLDSPVGP